MVTEFLLPGKEKTGQNGKSNKVKKLKALGKHKKSLKDVPNPKPNAGKEVSPKRRSDKTSKAPAANEKVEKSVDEAMEKAKETIKEMVLSF